MGEVGLFTKAQRESLLSAMNTPPFLSYMEALTYRRNMQRYEATVVELEAERDSLRRGADGLIDAGTAFMKERNALAKRLSEAESVRETFLQVLVALASSKTRQEAATNLEALLETIVP